MQPGVITAYLCPRGEGVLSNKVLRLVYFIDGCKVCWFQQNAADACSAVKVAPNMRIEGRSFDCVATGTSFVRRRNLFHEALPNSVNPSFALQAHVYDTQMHVTYL